MTIFVRLALCSLCFVSLVGCKPVKQAINKHLNAGKVEGVSQCVELSATEILSEETIRISCVAKFERELPYSVARNVTGSAGPRSQSGSNYFGGTLINDTEDHVVTEVIVEVEFRKSAEEEPQRARAEIRGWFEPTGDPISFRSKNVDSAPDTWGSVGYCDDPESNDCWGWYIVAVKGLRL